MEKVSKWEEPRRPKRRTVRDLLRAYNMADTMLERYGSQKEIVLKELSNRRGDIEVQMRELADILSLIDKTTRR